MLLQTVMMSCMLQFKIKMPIMINSNANQIKIRNSNEVNYVNP